MDALQRKHFDEAASSFLASCTSYLLNNLHFDNQIIKDARFFQPSLQQSTVAPNAIGRMTLSVAQALGTDHMRQYFQLGSKATKYDLCDVVKKEFREYQTSKIPEDEKKDVESNGVKARVQYCYWKYAYGLLDIEQTTTKSNEHCIKIDEYWCKVFLQCYWRYFELLLVMTFS